MSVKVKAPVIYAGIWCNCCRLTDIYCAKMLCWVTPTQSLCMYMKALTQTPFIHPMRSTLLHTWVLRDASPRLGEWCNLSKRLGVSPSS